jgi:hypothetical protein
MHISFVVADIYFILKICYFHPNSHAYLKFLDEETLQKTLVKLREQGPPREDFNFCRLVRYYEVEHAIKYSRGGVILSKICYVWLGILEIKHILWLYPHLSTVRIQ